MKLKEAMKEGKRTGKKQKVTDVVHGGLTKVNVSLRLDEEVVGKLKEHAAKLGLGYQTHINSILTQYVNEPTYFEQWKRLESQYAVLKNAVEVLQKKVDEKLKSAS